MIANTPSPQPFGGVEALLEEARRRTLWLGGVGGADLDRVHDPLMSPLAWDLGHITAFEDLWIGRETGTELLREDLAAVYDAFETPRAARGELRYLRHDELPGYMDAVRERTRGALERGRSSPASAVRRTRDGRFVIECHEVQDSIAEDVRDGLTRSPRELPPKLFYGERGSELFDRITSLPEYYPTRCEREILNRHAPTVVERAEAESSSSRLRARAARGRARARRLLH